jgi:hypothetical protein
VQCLEDNAFHYVCGYLLKRVRFWHECTECDKILLGGDGYAKRNETLTTLKKFTATSNLHNASPAFNFYVNRCEKLLLKSFKDASHQPDIGSYLLDCLKSIKVPTKCIGFPKYKFLILFVRVRIFYLLKFANASFASQPKNKVKDFSHK